MFKAVKKAALCSSGRPRHQHTHESLTSGTFFFCRRFEGLERTAGLSAKYSALETFLINSQTSTDDCQITAVFCALKTIKHTHTHTFDGPFSRTIRVSQHQKGKTSLGFTEARDSEWQWHQLGHMQVCTSLQTDNHASTPPLKFFTGRMPFLSPNQQRQSTEGTNTESTKKLLKSVHF